MAVEKLAAYLGRNETQPRDLYDLVWLLSRGTKLDLNFAQKNHLPPDLLEKARKKFVRERKLLSKLKAKLRPFLFDEKEISKLDFFGDLVK